MKNKEIKKAKFNVPARNQIVPLLLKEKKKNGTCISY